VPRTLPGHPQTGIVYVAPPLPAEAPDFAEELGIGPEGETWTPAAASGAGAALADSAGRPLVSLRAAARSDGSRPSPWRGTFLLALILVSLFLVGRGDEPWRVGISL